MAEIVLLGLIMAFVWYAAVKGKDGSGTQVGDGSDGVFPWDDKGM